jgi:DNA-binding GntR family transcriptional regulator
MAEIKVVTNLNAAREETPPPAESRGSLGQEAYAKLREAIDTRIFVPGHPVREQELSEILGMSRTPVREAIATLEAEGLITIDPRRGRVITKLDYQAVIELYAIREELEAYGARLAARHSSEAEIAALQAMLRRELELIPDIAAIVRHNRRFHQAICFAAKNRFLTRSIEALQGPLSLVGPTTQTDEAALRTTASEHAAIVEGIAGRDPEAAEHAMRLHIQSTQRARIDLLISAS